VTTYLICKQSVETESEGNDEEKENREESCERAEDIGEHDHINTKHGHLSDEEDQVNPGPEYSYRPKLPLPSLEMEVNTHSGEKIIFTLPAD
jgi:hypothetical protein